jgi:uncharacterized protein YqeY
MSLEDNINNQIKDAMRAKDKVVLEALRSIKSAILLAKTEKAGIDALDEATELKLLNKLLKQRRESAEIFTAQNRPELAQEEEAQAKVIEGFLPKQMSDAEVKAFLAAKLSEWGIQGPADFGKFMGAASKALAGQADGKVIAAVAKALLNG